PGLLEGKATAEYAKCVDISTAAALRQMVVPGLLAVVTPVLAGFVDPTGAVLGGLLAGVTSAGVLLAIFMSNAGGAWDNAKKYVESGKHGGKGSEAHKASVVGDTVGDPFKDTAGPSLNILLKLMSVVALVLAPVLASMQDKPEDDKKAEAPIEAPATPDADSADAPADTNTDGVTGENEAPKGAEHRVDHDHTVQTARVIVEDGAARIR